LSQILLYIRYENFKFKKKQNVKYSWLLTGTYHQNLAIWKKDLQNLAILDHFFNEKTFE
jgi:hypothetical protein